MTEHFTVHQGDGCCSLSPSCCPALGSDHFLCHFSFPAVLQGQHVRHASGPADTFPVVRDWEPILLAARTELDSWAAAVQESSSEEVVGLPQRCAKVSPLFDDLLRILWDTARLIHPRQTPMHRRRPQPRWWTGECFRALVARNAAWRDFRRSNLPADYVRFSSCRLYFHRLVRSTRRSYWRSWQDDISWMRIQNPQACASRIRRCFRSPTSRTAPHDSMIWRTPQAGTARPCDGWRDHFSSVVVPSTHDDFSSEFHCSMTLRFFELTSDQHSSGVFDAPFSESELSRALSKCHDSAPGLDGLRYSTFQQHLPWWRAMLLDFFNLLLSWNVVPSVWKLSQVVPVFKDGDPADPDRYRPISLASCAFKVFERLIHGRIAPHICNRLDDSQGGFRWGADACVYGLVDALRLRQDTHTFCAFVDIRKAFDTSWVEATLVRLHQSGVTGGMWRTIANFLCGTLSQVRVRGDVSPPWVDTGIAQGRVLSPLLFNLLVNSLAAGRASPGVRLVPSSDFRLTDQLYADDLVVLGESEADLQLALDAVTRWGRQWRFSFGVGPEKSAVMISDPPVQGRRAESVFLANLSQLCRPIATLALS